MGGANHRKASNSLRDWLVRACILLVTLVLCVGLFEIGCRLVGVDFSPNPVWKFHPVLGWTQEPGKVYEYLVDGQLVRVEFNRLGFRDVDHDAAGSTTRKRIVLIGDSFSEAVEVSLEETFFRRLQVLLNHSAQDEWEVINLGVGDFGHAQAWLALTEYGLDYAPDVVLFQMFPLNDICNNSIDLAGLCKSQNDAYRPYFVPNDGELELTSAQPIRQWLRLRIYTFGVLERLVMTLLDVDRDVNDLHRERYLALGFEEDPLLYTFADDLSQPETVARGWEMTEAIFRKIHGVCQSRGIALVPIVIPFELRVREGWERFAASHPRARMIQNYPEQRLGRLFEDLQVPYVFLKPVFEENRDVVLPSRAGHLNPAAHDLVARTVLEKLHEAGLVE